MIPWTAEDGSGRFGRRIARRRVDLREAAGILDTTVDAVRKRVKRGSLEGDKGADGRVYVWLGLDQTVSPEDVSASALVKAKDETIELLRQQLEQEREANRENRRLLAAALERIPELTAPEEARPETAPEATRGPEAASESAGRGNTPPESREWSPGHEGETYGTPPQEAEDSLHPRKRSWWREFFGLE